MNMLHNRPIARSHRRNRSNSGSRSGQCSRVLEYFFHAGHYHVVSLLVKVMRGMRNMVKFETKDKVNWET
jgi:hypothetical protein